MSPLVIRSFLLGLLLPVILGLTRTDFYPYGVEYGDTELRKGDEVSSHPIPLFSSVYFYGTRYQSLFVSTNGIISFGKAVSEYITERFPLDVSVISVFSTDVDTEAAGQVFYRETTDQRLLGQASTAIREYFPDQSSGFTANALFIVTWVDVGYYPDGDDKRNTFQAVIATDGERESFVFFHYEADGIQWWRTIQRPGRRSAGELPAQVGFNAGDGERFYLVPASGTDAVKNVNGWSNMNTGGAWLFQIGAFAGFQNIIPAQPKLESPIVDSDRSTSFNRNREPLVEVAPAPVDRTGQFNRDETPSNQDPFQVTFFNLEGQGQSSGCDSCHQNARCSRQGPISCCRCQEGYYGNGINCLPAGGSDSNNVGTPQRVNGKVEGTVRLSGKDEVDLRDIDLHSYVVVNDGRAYTAMSRIEENVGYAMQPLSTIGGIIGWLFGLPQANAVNGYTLTGGVFKRTAVVTFRPGNQVFQVEQDFQGVDDFGYLTMTTKLSGELPPIAAADKVVVGEYQEIYQKTAPGLIKSIASRGYTVGNRIYNYTWDQTIEYDEAGCNLPAEGLVTDSLRVDVSRNFVFFDNKEEIVRYAMTTKVSPMAGPPVAPVLNPCQTGQHDCHSRARCVALEGQQYTCECVGGYTGDGRNCQDIDECNSGTPPCAPNANCINEIGTFRCVCPPGYEGDGFSSCTPLSPQPSQNPCYDGTNDCDSIERARCIPLGAGRYRCECNPGFTGDGRTCVATPIQPPANPCDRASCAPPGQGFCVPVSLTQYRCECLPGFRDVNGDGRVCQAIQPPGPQPTGNPCDRANCAPEGQAKCIPLGPTDYRCECLPGYNGDGRVCTDMDECDLLDPACDPNARCINTFGSYRCECAPGFVGDGRTCSPVGQAPQASLLFAQGMSISRIPVPAQGYRGQIVGAQSAARGKKVLVKAGMTAVGIDYDCVDGYMYFTDVTGRSISRAKMDGSQPEVIISQGLSSPEGVAVDWISKNLYWTDSGTDVIEVSKLDGSNRRVLFKDDLVNPRSIVVEPFSGTMYWTDWNRDKPTIATANMDATNRRIFVDTEIALPNGITIDYPANQLCWADAGTKKVECATLGTAANRRTVYTPTQYPFSMTSYQGRLFYTDWQRDAVLAINPQSQTEQGPLPLPLGSSGNPYGITTITNTCRRGANACSVRNGDCSHLCLPRPGNQRSCVCPSNQYSNEAACVE
ncbi:PREDICTED: nidogen-1-like isoform X25 [Branchiostoma belcheri]|uniref:Nidogen-1-like isoform X25 n=1 Tax=Branchiostoma belcheri TaxID=7741 RepID=A0A6P4Y689_BRABE|nr:PREDICTED: nidogen-1-like isoform X25 [Branchiostoma belcheri]